MARSVSLSRLARENPGRCRARSPDVRTCGAEIRSPPARLPGPVSAPPARFERPQVGGQPGEGVGWAPQQPLPSVSAQRGVHPDRPPRGERGGRLARPGERCRAVIHHAVAGGDPPRCPGERRFQAHVWPEPDHLGPARSSRASPPVRTVWPAPRRRRAKSAPRPAVPIQPSPPPVRHGVARWPRLFRGNQSPAGGAKGGSWRRSTRSERGRVAASGEPSKAPYAASRARPKGAAMASTSSTAYTR